MGAANDTVEEAGHDTVSRARSASFKGCRSVFAIIPCLVRLSEAGCRAYPSHILPLLKHVLQNGG